MKFASIDPGQTGAVVIWDEGKPKLVLRSKYDDDKMPCEEMLQTIKSHGIRAVVIEKVNGITGQGAASSFNFGLGTGCWYGFFRGIGVDVVALSPGFWGRIAHKGMLKSIATKERSRMFVEREYPWILDMYPKADGVWDAVCIGAAALKEGLVK